MSAQDLLAGSPICAPWVTVEDPLCGCTEDEQEDTALPTWLLVASIWLYRLSGRQWPGVCQDEVHPLLCGDLVVQWVAYTRGGARPLVALDGTGCGCGAPDLHGGHSAIRLAGPVVEVQEVHVDGVLVDPGEYAVLDRRWLVRRSGSWPSSAEPLAAGGEPRSFVVRYRHGAVPDISGRVVAGRLGCELLRQCVGAAGGADCQLSEKVTAVVREGVSYAMVSPPASLLDDKGRLGIPVVDNWLGTVNPKRTDRAAKVLDATGATLHRIG